MHDAETRIRSKAFELGFTKVGIALAQPLGTEVSRLQEWLQRGFHATMGWMARGVEKRADPRTVLPDARSVVSVALNYFVDVRHADRIGTGRISRYAWGDDYHEILLGMLNELSAWMEKEFPGTSTKSYVDTGPIMEKVWAQRAGLGWIGKHTNLITQEKGSWVFLGELITTLELHPDPPATDHCGDCTLCIDACPTDAIVAPYVLDSNRCLSYLTIEHRGEFPVPVNVEGWIYGCDTCQDVCPWNRKFSGETEQQGFFPREGNAAPVLEEWVDMTHEDFVAKFRKSPVKRTRVEGLRRNVRNALEQQSSSEKADTFRVSGASYR